LAEGSIAKVVWGVERRMGEMGALIDALWWWCEGKVGELDMGTGEVDVVPRTAGFLSHISGRVLGA